MQLGKTLDTQAAQLTRSIALALPVPIAATYKQANSRHAQSTSTRSSFHSRLPIADEALEPGRNRELGNARHLEMIEIAQPLALGFRLDQRFGRRQRIGRKEIKMGAQLANEGSVEAVGGLAVERRRETGADEFGRGDRFCEVEQARCELPPELPGEKLQVSEDAVPRRTSVEQPSAAMPIVLNGVVKVVFAAT